MIDTALKTSQRAAQISTEEYTKSILNILEDFSEEKAQLEKTQRAVLNIIEDSSVEKMNLEGTQSAVLNILEDFTGEKDRLEETQRAVLNVLEDFSEANARLREEMEERNKAEEQVKKSLREKEVLLREIHHRVKNNLQIIQSMLNLQLPQIKDENSIALFKESQNRVYSMALIHEKLYQSESLSQIDFPEYITSLAAYLFTSYGAVGRAIRPRIQVKDVSLDVDTTIPCALIINELVSNSLKYAFPPSRRAEGPGEISVSLTRDTGNSILLTVSDNGVGLPEGFEIEHSDSLGLKLVSVLVKQLGGVIRIGGGGPVHGTKFSITFAARNEKGA